MTELIKKALTDKSARNGVKLEMVAVGNGNIAFAYWA